MSSGSRLNRPDVGIFTREDFERAWQSEPPPHHCAPSGTAILVYRNSACDFEQHQVHLSIDDEPVGEIRYGEVLSRRVAPGRHTVRAFNAWFAETLTIEVHADKHVRLHCGRGVDRPRWLKRLFPGVASLPVWLARY